MMKNSEEGQVWGLVTVIPATQTRRSGGSRIEASPEKKS
jgi:hypothetical protein